MEPTSWEGPTPARSQSNIRNILEQVKSGAKNKSEAFTELRSILNSSAGKGIGSSEERKSIADQAANDEEKNHGHSSSHVPSRFSQEDRRMLINKLIEKKRRSDENTPIAALTGANLSASELLQGDYRSERDNYNSRAEHQAGDDEERWDTQEISAGNIRGSGNGVDQRFLYDGRDRGEREEKGSMNFPSHNFGCFFTYSSALKRNSPLLCVTNWSC
jgi:hypothetical protein